MNSLDKMEEARNATYKLLDKGNPMSWRDIGPDEIWELAWNAAIAHDNSKHSAILEDYDRLAKLAEKQDKEIERLEDIEQKQFHLNEQLLATIAMQAEALKPIAEYHCAELCNCTRCNAHKALSRSTEPISEWEEKKLEPLQRQVAMLSKKYRECAYYFGEEGYPEYLKECTEILSNTQAAVDAFMAERDVKVRNDCIQEIEMLRVAHDPRLAVPGDEYYVKAISTLRASANRKDE